ncbi:ROK family protein, partial [bacterium]|nr:ROK family protein [bacterium]
KTMNYPSHSSPPEVLELLVKTIRALLKDNNLDPNKIFGIGVALPGIVNYEEGHLNENPFPEGWQGFKLRKTLEDQMETTVFIENDVKTLTLGEYQFGTGYHVDNMICLWLEDGIGVGLVHNGRLIRGTTSSAGEIGYSEFFVDLPFKKTILMDGSSRRWGDILSFTNLQNTIRRGIDQGWKTDLKKESSIDDLIASALARDPLALYILRLEGQFIGNIVMNLIYTFNPQVFLLVGLLFNRLPLLSEEIQKSLSQGLLQSPLETLEMRTSNLGENGITVGGAALVLEHLFKDS